MAKPIYTLFRRLLSKLFRGEVIYTDVLRMYRNMACEYEKCDVGGTEPCEECPECPCPDITLNLEAFLTEVCEDTNIELVDEGDVPVVPVSVVGSKITVPSGAAPSGVHFKFPVPEQYASHRTGDEGDRVQTGWYDYTPPAIPKVIAALDYTSANHWYVLESALSVGGVSSTTRFVDVDGGQTFDVTDNKNLILIDKLTSIGIYRPQDNSLLKPSWDAAIDDGLTLSIVVDGITYDNWYLASHREFIGSLGILITSSGWVDPVTGITLLATLFTGSQLGYITSTTSPANSINSLMVRFNASGLVDIIPFGKASSNGRPLYIFDAKSLITAP